MRALLVGIAPGSGAVIAHVLDARGHPQTLVDDGVSGLEVVRRDSPSLIVVEDPLVDMAATDFCRQARACPQGADAVILVMTNRDAELPAVLDAGATDLYATSLG